MLHSEDQWLLEHKNEIAAKIEKGLDQIERGEVYTPEESRANMARRKAEWLRSRPSQRL